MDDDLLIELRRVVQEADPVPEAVIAAAQAAIATRDLDGELAGLVADSAGGHGRPALAEAVRAGHQGGGARLLSFAAGPVQLDLDVIQRGRVRDITGQITGAAADGCVLEYA